MNDGGREMSDSDVLPFVIKVFENAKDRSKELGAGAALSGAIEELFTLARLSQRKDVFLMFLDVKQMGSILNMYAWDRIEENLKKKIKESETLPAESNNAIEKLIGSIDLAELQGEGDFFETEKVYDQLKKVITALDDEEQNYILNEVLFGLQREFNETYFKVLPDELSEFYDGILDALKTEGISRACEKIQNYMSILNNKIVGFPKI